MVHQVSSFSRLSLLTGPNYYKMENDLSVCLILSPTKVSFVILVTDFITKIANLRQLNSEGPSASYVNVIHRNLYRLYLCRIHADPEIRLWNSSAECCHNLRMGAEARYRSLDTMDHNQTLVLRYWENPTEVLRYWEMPFEVWRYMEKRQPLQCQRLTVKGFH